jgi:hypothetical protein
VALRLAEHAARAAEHQPTLEVVRRFGEPSLEAGHHLLDLRPPRVVEPAVVARRDRLVPQAGRTEGGVEA